MNPIHGFFKLEAYQKGAMARLIVLLLWFIVPSVLANAVDHPFPKYKDETILFAVIAGILCSIVYLRKKRSKIEFYGIKYCNTDVEIGTLSLPINNIKLTVKKKEFTRTKYYGANGTKYYEVVHNGSVGEIIGEYKWNKNIADTERFVSNIHNNLRLRVILHFSEHGFKKLVFSVSTIRIEKDDSVLYQFGLVAKQHNDTSLFEDVEFAHIVDNKINMFGLAVNEIFESKIIGLSYLLMQFGLDKPNVSISVLPGNSGARYSALHAYGLVGGLLKGLIDFSAHNEVIRKLDEHETYAMLRQICKKNNWTLDGM